MHRAVSFPLSLDSCHLTVVLLARKLKAVDSDFGHQGAVFFEV